MEKEMKSKETKRVKPCGFKGHISHAINICPTSFWIQVNFRNEHILCQFHS